MFITIPHISLIKIICTLIIYLSLNITKLLSITYIEFWYFDYIQSKYNSYILKNKIIMIKTQYNSHCITKYQK